MTFIETNTTIKVVPRRVHKQHDVGCDIPYQVFERTNLDVRYHSIRGISTLYLLHCTKQQVQVRENNPTATNFVICAYKKWKW